MSCTSNTELMDAVDLQKHPLGIFDVESIASLKEHNNIERIKKALSRAGLIEKNPKSKITSDQRR